MLNVKLGNRKLQDISYKSPDNDGMVRKGRVIILMYNIITILIIAIFYPLIPILQNYPPNNEEVSAALGTSNIMQYLILGTYSLAVGTVILIKQLKVFKSWGTVSPDSPEGIEIAKKIRRVSMNLPNSIFTVQIATFNIPIFLVGILVTTLNNSPKMVVAKVIMMTVSLSSLAAVSTYIFSKRLFKDVLLKTYNGGNPEGKRLSIKKNIFIQITPMLVVAILFTTLIGYSRVIAEKGDQMYTIYKSMLLERVQKSDINSVDDAFNLLKDVKFGESTPLSFVRTPDGNITTSNGSVLGGYFLYYITKPYNGDRMFDLNAETQGTVISVNGKDGTWKLGLIFQVASEKTISFFTMGFITLLLLNIIVLYYFVKSLSDDISLVAESLTDIANGEYVDMDKKLPVTSNDEIGDLVIAFNKIQKREKEHIKEVEEQQAIIIERERLASLGQLIGGIAHNIRTPIMSISGAIEGLKDLVKEYKESVGDPSVSVEDHHEIAREMNEWLNKMGPYCTYMSDMLTAVKEQTVHHYDSEKLEFTVGELTRRVELLMNNELKRSCCYLRTRYNIDMNTVISGDISILVQVLNNLITNAIQAYTEPGKDIEFNIQGNGNKVELVVKDTGVGMSENTKDKLFKEMVTTKGKQGTGLGLFISYSNIKARFKGNMWFESEEGKGTTFYVSIPVRNSL